MTMVSWWVIQAYLLIYCIYMHEGCNRLKLTMTKRRPLSLHAKLYSCGFSCNIPGSIYEGMHLVGFCDYEKLQNRHNRRFRTWRAVEYIVPKPMCENTHMHRHRHFRGVIILLRPCTVSKIGVKTSEADMFFSLFATFNLYQSRWQ